HLRQADGETIELFGHHDLATETRRLGQAEGKIEHVFLVLGRVLQQLIPFGFDDDVTGRARQRAFARALDIDVIAVGDFENRQADRRLYCLARPVTFDKCHLGHSIQSINQGRGEVIPTAGDKSSAIRAAPRAAASGPASRSIAADCATTRRTVNPAALAAVSSAALSRPSGVAITAWVTGRASCFSARARNASSTASSACPAVASRRSPSAPGRISALPPSAIATAADPAAKSMPTTAPGPSAESGAPSGSSI